MPAEKLHECSTFYKKMATGVNGMNELVRNKYIKRLQRLSNWHAGDECIIWTGAARNGYGRMRFNGVPTNAQRVSYILFVGAIPDGHMVLHRCTTKACINPKHLFTGTQAENMRELVAQGRHCRKPRYQPKLDWAKADAIRIDPRPYDQIGLDHGVSRSTVSNIKSGKTWARKA